MIGQLPDSWQLVVVTGTNFAQELVCTKQKAGGAGQVHKARLLP